MEKKLHLQTKFTSHKSQQFPEFTEH